MDYRESMDFIKEISVLGSRPGLENITALMKELGDVQEQLALIHIAGTNGKGSVGAMIASVFTAASYKAGHFSTPDVLCYEEEFCEESTVHSSGLILCHHFVHHV